MKRQLVIGCAFISLAAFGCDEDFDPPSLIRNLRVLDISAEPADLTLGESMTLQALVAAPNDAEVTYRWEWCPFTQGADELFACEIEELDPEAAALFNLGDEATATLESSSAWPVVVGICQALTEGLDDLGEYAEYLESIDLPDCDVGMDVTIRLTVSTPDIERVAIKRVFVWLSEPDDRQRNRNPVIDSIEVNEQELPDGTFFEAAPAAGLRWYIDVPESSLETFLLRSDPSAGERRESLTYAFFATTGGWDDEGGFADDRYVTREEGGENVMRLPANATPSSTIDTYFVVRDERGGSAWATRQVRVTE